MGDDWGEGGCLGGYVVQGRLGLLDVQAEVWHWRASKIRHKRSVGKCGGDWGGRGVRMSEDIKGGCSDDDVLICTM